MATINKPALRSKIGVAVRQKDPQAEADARAELAYVNITEFIDTHATYLKAEQFDLLEIHLKTLKDAAA